MCPCVHMKIITMSKSLISPCGQGKFIRNHYAGRVLKAFLSFVCDPLSFPQDKG